MFIRLHNYIFTKEKKENCCSFNLKTVVRMAYYVVLRIFYCSDVSVLDVVGAADPEVPVINCFTIVSTMIVFPVVPVVPVVAAVPVNKRECKKPKEPDLIVNGTSNNVK